VALVATGSEWVRAFLDLQGASGATYRYRLAPDGDVGLPTAGNYVCVREQGEDFGLLASGTTFDLSSATADWRRAVAQHGPAQLFVRLNVSASVREAEEQDIAAYYATRRDRGSAPESSSGSSSGPSPSGGGV
jgi:hypothetical protein